MLMIEENEAPEVHEGSGQWEKWHGKVTEQKKRGITLKLLGWSSVFLFSVLGRFVPPEGQEDGEAAKRRAG